MAEKENILDTIFDDENLDDVDMLDADIIEEGEIEEQNQCVELTEVAGRENEIPSQESGSRNCRRRAKKKKKKNSCSFLNVTDINRFVIDTCRRLKERKSYLVWNAVGCLGVSAVSNLIKEVDAIQACGGQMTADGNRSRTGGGILWSILKVREPKAYKEIMAKGKEFEKQFRQHNVTRGRDAKTEVLSSERIAQAPSDQIEKQVSNHSQLIPQALHDLEQHNADEKRVSVLNRIRVPVAYDDLLGEDTKEEST